MLWIIFSNRVMMSGKRRLSRCYLKNRATHTKRDLFITMINGTKGTKNLISDLGLNSEQSTSQLLLQRMITISRSEFSGVKPVGRLISRTTILTSLGPKALWDTRRQAPIKPERTSECKGVKPLRLKLKYRA